MTQLTFTFETVPANPNADRFVTASTPAEQPRPAAVNTVIAGRIPRRNRRQGLQQLSDVLNDVLAQYEEKNQ